MNAKHTPAMAHGRFLILGEPVPVIDCHTETMATVIARSVNAHGALLAALESVIGCVEDLNDCEGWHDSDPHSRSGKLNAACDTARAAIRLARGG